MSDDLINKKEALNLLRKRSHQLVGIYGDLGGAVSGAAKLIDELPTADRPQERIPCSKRLECEFCLNHEQGDTLYEPSDWDGGIGFDYIRNIKYCPLCGTMLKGAENETD